MESGFSLRKAFNQVTRPLKALALCVSLGLGLSTMFARCSESDELGQPYRDGHPVPEVINMKHSPFRTVAIPYITRTGQIVNYRKMPGFNTVINFDHDDFFTRALDTIEENSCERIKRDPALQELLAKDNWTREDRIKWERIVSAIVSDEANKIPGFDDYRTPSKDDVKHAWILNQLSEDIAADSTKLEFDCESMSIVEGIVLQKIDDQFLYGTGEGNYKKSTTYYLASGYVGLGSNDEDLGAHSFLISSITGSIIEGTSDPDFRGSTPYHEVLNPGYGLGDFLKDRPAVTWDAKSKDVFVYLPRHSKDDYVNAQESVAGKVDSLRMNLH